MFVAGLFLLGICVGSFLNVLIDRIPREEPFLKSRSHCDFCKKKLSWLDLIPLLSFLFLKGKCRYCHSPLSYYYPIVEFTTGFLFIFTANFILNNFQSNINFQLNNITSLLYYLFIISSLIVIFFTDLKYGIIPDKILYLAIALSLIFNPSTSSGQVFQFFPQSGIPLRGTIFNSLLSGLAAFLLFLFLFLLTKGRGMGFGDVKYVFLMGLFLGFPKIIVGIYLSFLTGAIVSLILVLWGKKKFHGGKIPFGPFLVLGTLLSAYWGEQILKLFLSSLFS